MPKRPTVNAIAPNAPTGASRMIIARMRNSTCAMPSMNSCYPPPGASARIQCEAEQKGEQQDRQHLAFLESADKRLRNHMKREFDESVRQRARRILREDRRVQMMRVDVQAGARVQRECGREPQNERNDRENVEQRQRLQDGPPDLGAARKRGNAGDDRAEDDWRDHHAYQRDERIAERFKRCAGLWPEMANGHAEPHAEQDLDVKQPERPCQRHFGVFFAAARPCRCASCRGSSDKTAARPA